MAERSEETSIIPVAREIVLKSRTQQYVIVNTKACGHQVVELHVVPTSPQNSLEDRAIMDVSPERPFYLLVSNVSDREEWLSKHMKIDETAEYPSIAHTIGTDDQKAFLMKTSEAFTYLKFSASGDNISMKVFQQIELSAVPCKAGESRNSQISRHPALNEASSKNVQNRPEKTKLSELNSQYCDKFADMLSKFQKMWDGYLGRFYTAKKPCRTP